MTCKKKMMNVLSDGKEPDVLIVVFGFVGTGRRKNNQQLSSHELFFFQPYLHCVLWVFLLQYYEKKYGGIENFSGYFVLDKNENNSLIRRVVVVEGTRVHTRVVRVEC